MLLFFGVFFVTSVAGNDGCCEESSSEPSAYSQMVDAADDHHDEDAPTQCDRTSCVGCIRCGTGSTMKTDLFVFPSTIPAPLEFASYRLPYAPAPDLSGLIRPPIS